MAKEEITEEGSAPKEKKSSHLLIIIIIVMLILIIIIGAVVAVLLMSGNDGAMEAAAVPQAKEKTVSKSTTRSSSSSFNDARKLDEIGILYSLDTFTVNLKSDSGRRYLKTTIFLELEDEELNLELDAKAPVLQDKIIRILSSKTLEEVSSKKGKQKVSEQITNTLNAMLTDGKIKAIYFTTFVIQ